MYRPMGRLLLLTMDIDSLPVSHACGASRQIIRRSALFLFASVACRDDQPRASHQGYVPADESKPFPAV